MSDNRTAVARVQVTFDVPASGCWGLSCALAQVEKQATEEALMLFSNNQHQTKRMHALMSLGFYDTRGIYVVGKPKVTTILISDEVKPAPADAPVTTPYESFDAFEAAPTKERLRLTFEGWNEARKFFDSTVDRKNARITELEKVVAACAPAPEPVHFKGPTDQVLWCKVSPEDTASGLRLPYVADISQTTCTKCLHSYIEYLKP